MYKNVSIAFYDLLDKIIDSGETVVVQEQETKELIAVVCRIEHPDERVYVVPSRNNNIFATVAETVWVMAGRNDIEYLTHYLPRAPEFSDDGQIWRAGYGPRLRRWHNKVDQILEVVSLLQQSRNSRRAVMVLFDPEQDYVKSKDIPCNNWLQFIIRDDKLHLNVTIRSNDFIWGFSGINTFEWSVLQEMIAYWTNSKIGTAHFFIGSLHVYKYHFDKAQQIRTRRINCDVYEYGFSSPRFNTSLNDFNEKLDEWFRIERESRKENNIDWEPDTLSDPLLDTFLQMIIIYNAFKNGAPSSLILDKVVKMPPSDLKIAVCEYFFRQYHIKSIDGLSSQESELLNIICQSKQI